VSTAPRRQGFTLAEVVIAVSVTAIIGLAVAGVAYALCNASEQARGLRYSIQSARAGSMRIETLVRKSKLVCGTGKEEMTLWTGDDNNDGKINLDEIILIHRLGDTKNLESWRVLFPQSLSDWWLRVLNVQLELRKLDDPAALRSVMELSVFRQYLVTRILAAEVEEFEVGTDEVPPFSLTALWKLTAGPPGQQMTLRDAAHLRADAVDSIVLVDGRPVLTVE